jgi:signal transduction histidine kinase
MKSSKKFIITFLSILFLFTAIGAIVSAISLEKIKDNTNIAVKQIISNVKEKYPNLSDNQIADILNGESDTADTDKLLKKYGIDTTEWIVFSNEQLNAIAICVNSVVCLISGLALLTVFVFYIRKTKLENNEITNYIQQINNGNYTLKIEENSEDENSILKNEVYKTTVKLREQSENSRKDKEALRDSLSDISHQLKTPLTSAMIMLDNLIDDENMPENIKREFLSDIKRSTNNISFLVQSLLTLSKLDAGTIKFNLKNENLKSIFDDCIQNNTVLAEIKNVNTINICDETIEICCDYKWICEAISNILKNCIEHTQENGEVKLSAERNKLYTKIIISDNGTGIYPDDLPHIFERFYKGKNSNDDSVGIGLALAKEIVEKNGGYISVDSQLGKGTIFIIRFFQIDNS